MDSGRVFGGLECTLPKPDMVPDNTLVKGYRLLLDLLNRVCGVVRIYIMKAVVIVEIYQAKTWVLKYYLYLI